MYATKIITNVHNRYVRREQLQGREHIVAPVNLLVPGVHKGSNGPLLYPRDELAKYPEAWNMRPVVVYHPANGSAATPAELEKRQVGVLMNTHWDNRKLRSEAWLLEDRLRAIDPSILAALQSNKPMEVSTGLFTDNAPTPGVYNGRDYQFVARNYRPDHLAILPTGVGACSVAAGCGMLTNNKETAMEEPLIMPTINWADGTIEQRTPPQPAPVANAAPQPADTGWDYLEGAVVAMRDDGHPDAEALQRFVDNQRAANTEPPLVAPTMNFGCGCDNAPTQKGGYTARQPANNATGGDVGGETPLVAPTMQFGQ